MIYQSEIQHLRVCITEFFVSLNPLGLHQPTTTTENRMKKIHSVEKGTTIKMDFSQLNLQYLIQARDLSKRNLQLAAAILGINDDMACLISDLPPQTLSQIIQIKPPLLIPRQEVWWWSRLIRALRDGYPAEIETVIEHAEITTKTYTNSK